MSSKKLNESRIVELTRSMPEWKLKDGAISKTYVFDRFVQSMAFVNRIAAIAEEVQHHPDIDIRYNKVTLLLTTHDAGGLTDSDFDLAKRADEIISASR